MAHDDMLITPLHQSVKNLQNLIAFLESGRETGGNNRFYCQRKLKEVRDQLKSFEHLLAQQRAAVPSASLFWN